MAPTGLFQQHDFCFQKPFFKRALRRLGRELLLRALPNQRPDIALVAGSSWRTDPRFLSARVKIPAHSFDYERYRQVNAKSFASDGQEWALYIDENLQSHEDNSQIGLDNPVTFQRFSPALKAFFNQFEQRESGMPVRIAAYPSARNDVYHTALFGDRDVVFGQTAELIRGAAVVFALGSTSNIVCNNVATALSLFN